MDGESRSGPRRRRRATRLRFRRLAVTSLLAAGALAAAPAVAGAAPCTGADAAPAALGRRNSAHVTLCLLNRERHAQGLRALRVDRTLSRAADGHAHDMVAQHYFDHTSRSGTSFSARIQRAGWMRGRRAWTVGENIGWGSGDMATPQAMVNAWIRSESHRANILRRRFSMIGIGIALGVPTGDSRGATYSADFGG